MKSNSKMAAFPYILWLLFFTIIPMVLVLYFAATSKDTGSISLENIANASKYFPVLIRSVYLAIIATAICLLIAYPLAFTMSRCSKSMQRVLLLLVMLPMWMNFLLRTYAWITLLDNNGLINSFLTDIGLPKLQLINNRGAVVLGMVYNYLPFMITPLYSIMTKIVKRFENKSEDESLSV